ncbi:MAG: hypothetical protein ACRCZF_15365, partial [Gemmataceae bacterium]
MMKTPETLSEHVEASPGTRWLARFFQLSSCLFLLTLFPLLFLVVDLFVWKGLMPTYEGLHRSRQLAFQKDWDARLGQNPDIQTILRQIREPEEEGYPGATAWEWRWQAVVYHTLQSRVNETAARDYLRPNDQNFLVPTQNRLGILSILAREHDRWPSGPISGFARGLPWSWIPSQGADFNPDY